jgi:hypothetical protein
MNRRQMALAALAAVALTLAAFRIQGEPIRDKDIVLEEDPPQLTVSGKTDRSGAAMLPVKAGHTYTIRLDYKTAEDLARRSTTVARIEVGRTVVTSAPLAPTGLGPAWFNGRDGKRLKLTIPRGVERVRIILTEGPVAGTGPAEAAISTSRSNIKKPDNPK